MKLKVTRFKSLQLCLKELEPFIRDGQHLSTGRAFKSFGGLRSRELLANWLMCAVLNADRSADAFTFTSDPEGGDGIIYDIANAEAWPTEHVLVPCAAPGETRGIPALILEAVAQKQARGPTYARGKTLVVFLDAGLGEWSPNQVARQLPKVDFNGVWVVGLHSYADGQYIYGVTQLDVSSGNAPTWLVKISADFASWKVERMQ